MLPFVAPVYRISVGSWRVARLRRFDAFSSRLNPTDTAEIEIPYAGFPAAGIATGDAVQIQQGYREAGLWTIFAGQVDRIRPDGQTVMLLCKDRMAQLEGLRLTQSFINVTPQEIVRFVMERAGVTGYLLSSRRLPPLPSFVCMDEPATSILRRIAVAWGLADWTAYFEPEGHFWWGPRVEAPGEQPDVPVISYGQSLLDLSLQNPDRGTVETVALPYLRPGHRMILADPRVWPGRQSVRIDRIRYHHGERRARCYIEWSRLATS